MLPQRVDKMSANQTPAAFGGPHAGDSLPRTDREAQAGQSFFAVGRLRGDQKELSF